MKMKHLKWGVALVLSLAMATPLGFSMVHAQEESVELAEESPAVIKNEATENEKTTPTTNVETHYYTVYVKVGESTTVSMSDEYDTWVESSGYEEILEYKENLNSGFATNGITITGKSAGQATLTRSYTDMRYDLDTGPYSVDVNDVYTVIVVDENDAQMQARMVDVVLIASTIKDSRPEDYTEPDGRYYHIGTMVVNNLPAPGKDVVVNIDEYAATLDKSSFVADPNNQTVLTYDDIDSWYILTSVQREDGTYYWRLQGRFAVNDVETQKYVYTDGVENEEVFANKTYTTVKGTSVPKFSTDGSNPTREGYEFVDWNKTVQEDGTIVYEAQWKAVEKESASLEIEFIDKDTKESVGENQVIQSEPGIVGEEYTFVSGEYEVTIPEGYKCISEYPTVPVKYGESTLVKLYVEKMTNPAQPGQEEDANNESQNGTDKKSEQTDGTNTGVAMSLVGVFGTMSIALAGMITLLKKKK